MGRLNFPGFDRPGGATVDLTGKSLKPGTAHPAWDERGHTHCWVFAGSRVGTGVRMRGRGPAPAKGDSTLGPGLLYFGDSAWYQGR
jgi:hypothetical protein